ncbi:biotin transporter BioY [Halobacteria archaeon AArc-m2/3/4]|uniref:Biotin transporter BioY n=1 Tax=Natronoglomus mannanivorans TaxID=2979990 RepID=A0AAP3E097_9EURY|nr:biotin transporter BioY [Halobacteria archaeon AArc-xg1-1]MCU4973031.1 biotin transporter BioY [Halobacteria archaeon AArc-m2/3/4]
MNTENEHESVDLVDGTVVRQFARAALLAALMGAAALVTIPYPLSPAPVTLQVLVVFLAGLYLGPLWGGASIVLYLAAGAAGAPVFSNMTGGPGVLLSEPTAGFLWAFPIGALVVGLVVHRGLTLRDPADVPLPIVVVGLTAGLILIYAGGTSWFAWLIGTSLSEAAVTVAIPFVPADLLKLAAAVVIVRSGTIDTV